MRSQSTHLRFSATILTLATLFASAVPCQAGDWPMWRHDVGRTAAMPDELPGELHPQWSRQLPPARPAWPASQTKLQFDTSYEPIVLGNRLIVGSTVNDSITAYSTDSGEQKWRFYTDGPVRFAPAGADGRIYVVSDDGYLYCIDAQTGTLQWKVNGGPTERSVIGNDRMVSSWPARGGPVVADGVVYFTASLWPFMGIFIHAVDADTGQIVWTNSELGSQYTRHPHNADSFGSVVPQGYLAVDGDKLLVPGGRSLPAIFDRKTGKLEHFEFGDKSSGGYGVMVAGDKYFVRSQFFQLEDGLKLGMAYASVTNGNIVLGTRQGKEPIRLQTVSGTVESKITKDRKGRKRRVTTFEPDEQWEIPLEKGTQADVFFLAGKQVYTGTKNSVARFKLLTADEQKDLPKDERQTPAWQADVDGEVSTMLAGDDKLFAVTKEGRIYCFGPSPNEPTHHNPSDAALPAVADEWSETARHILGASGASTGYAVSIGVGSGRLIDEVLRQSQLHVVVVDPDAEAVAAFRQRMDAAGLYGTRVAAVVRSAENSALPPYMANLIVSEQPAELETRFVETIFQALRPYGGVAWFPTSNETHREFAQTAGTADLENAAVTRSGDWTLLKRVGPLPDAANWTHQYADSANSVVSKDKRVKLPLGLLWFGGPPNDKVLPRHGHGPSPQVAGGRLIIEGPDMLRAVDVYTGRVLWERELKDVGKYYDVTRHFPGAGEIGTNYVSLPDRVYVVYGSQILALDAATGKTTREFALEDGEDSDAVWGFATVWNDLLVATSSPVELKQKKKSKKSDKEKGDEENLPANKITDVLTPASYASASRRLLVFNRHTGELLWSRDAEFNFRHNAIAVEAGKLFCIDGVSPKKLQALKRRGIDASGQAKLLALDAGSGEEVWSVAEDVFGTFMNYSVEHDVLLQGGSAYRDRATDEVSKGLAAYRGSTGELLWKDLELKYGGPCLLWHDKVITNGGGGFQMELLTGKRTDWGYTRMYGCNTAVGSEHLLTFRSGAAGFCDLTGKSGTGNIGGFRSSCTANLIAADGVLNAPDYTRTCICAYQNQASLALIHMPEAEMWTFSQPAQVKTSSERVGINLGAPGDRRGPDDTLWRDFPSTGGPSPKLQVKVSPSEVTWFRKHSSLVEGGEGQDWIVASGVEGIESLTLTLSEEEQAKLGIRAYKVRLHFAEPEPLEPGERVFSVKVGDTPFLDDFDVVKEANGPNRGLVRTFDSTIASEKIEITLRAREGSRKPILCGVEIIAGPRAVAISPVQ